MVTNTAPTASSLRTDPATQKTSQPSTPRITAGITNGLAAFDPAAANLRRKYFDDRAWVNSMCTDRDYETTSATRWRTPSEDAGRRVRRVHRWSSCRQGGEPAGQRAAPGLRYQMVVPTVRKPRDS
ncbi:hypothetical protein ACWT_4350 [Actinoplanes sp. SE50]|nr:hypothetical protein ACPL_4479 [Actinoplanes sp. SE50/110]ATO83765.1 hypothetical protein ACWT_4350 [Actinoplanes sp. SE50]SLM01173.1 uncharacterized protein ACSP50_4406 [Actinoplanes sp. SE50/110]